MERKKYKLKSTRNGEKSIKFKLRSLSIPRSLSKIKRDNNRKNSDTKLSNVSSGSVSPDTRRSIFYKMTKSTISSESHERIEMNSIHDDLFLECENENLNMKNLSIGSDANTPIPEDDKSNGPHSVKLRIPKFSGSSPTDTQFYTCKANFSPPLSPYSCRDSLTSVTSISSISSLSSQLSYEFTTRDRYSIATYGIEVNPINQLGCAEIIKEESVVHKSSLIFDDELQKLVPKSWPVEELQRKSELFNQNGFGLTSEMRNKNNEEFLLGTVRVYINLLRPIQMELTPRPSSIFDVLGYNSHLEDHNISNIISEQKVETIWLPRGTSKRLFVNQLTPAREVINGLLTKFHIRGNHKSFGLYDHTIEGERKVSVRKLDDTECPLGTMLSWAEYGVNKMNEIMAFRRLVLQENETGGIEWNHFLRPELENFLKILKREEDEIKTKIELKYSILKSEIKRLLQEKRISAQ